MRGDDEWNREARGEDAVRRADRNFLDILQELRVAQTGVQILFALLLTVAFTNTFQEADDFQKTVYVITLTGCAVATALLIAPAAYHRVLFQRGMKTELVAVSHNLIRAGMAVLIVCVTGALMLVVDQVVDRPTAIVLSSAVAVVFLLLWFVLPTRMLPDKDDRP